MALEALYLQPATGDGAIPQSASLHRAFVQMSFNQGVVSGFAVGPRAAGPNLSIDVGPGFAVVEGTEVSDQGSYPVRNTTTVNVPAPAPPSTGTVTRTLVLRIRDRSANTALAPGTYRPEFEWLGPNLVAPPPSSIAIAQVRLESSTASITSVDSMHPTRWATPRFPGPTSIVGSHAFADRRTSNLVSVVLDIPAAPWPRLIEVNAVSFLEKTVGDVWDVFLRVNGDYATIGNQLLPAARLTSPSGGETVNLHSIGWMAADSTVQLFVEAVKISGANGPMTCFGDARFSYINAMAVPFGPQ